MMTLKTVLICNECGTTNDRDAIYCKRCGANKTKDIVFENNCNVCGHQLIFGNRCIKCEPIAEYSYTTNKDGDSK